MVARGVRDDQPGVTPSADRPVSTPDRMFSGSDQFNLTQMMMELQHSIGRMDEKLKGIDTKLGKHGDKLDLLTEKYHFFKGAAWVIGILLGLLVAMVGWQLKDRFEIRAVDSRPAVSPKSGG